MAGATIRPPVGTAQQDVTGSDGFGERLEVWPHDSGWGRRTVAPESMEIVVQQMAGVAETGVQPEGRPALDSVECLFERFPRGEESLQDVGQVRAGADGVR